MSHPTVELPAVARFVRQHTHDIRNHLNGLDLEAALLAEIVTDPEGVKGIERLRQQIHALAGELKTVADKFSRDEPNRAPISARELFLIWQDQAAALGLGSIAWSTTLGGEQISVDVAVIGDVLQELLVNAKQFTGAQGLTARAGLRGAKIGFELREAKPQAVDPSSWGRQPFVSTKRGGYGLGLWQADQMIAANGGEITRTAQPDGTLVTQLLFPLA